MPKITFLPQNITVETQINSPLLSAARLAGVSVETPCGGKGVCRKCLVKILAGKVDVKAGTYRNEKENHALICQTNIADEDVTVEILSGLYGEEGQFDDVSDLPDINDFMINPTVKQMNLHVSEPAPLDGLSDFDRLKKSLKSNVKISLPMLSFLPVKLRENNGEINIIYYLDGDVLNIIDINNNDIYGVAVDIGTTTVTLWLVDLITGKIISRKTDYNAQIECGLDVITRINYAQKHLGELKERVLRTVNNLIKTAADENNININQIYCASLTGNTVMVHLFLGICPEYIRLYPYTPAVFKIPAFNANETGININPNAPVKFAPSVGSYVGGDILQSLSF